MAVTLIEGVHQQVLRYHYDVLSDVLYLRFVETLDEEVYGEEDEQGFHILRTCGADRVAGLTIVGYWRRFGGEQPLLATADLEPVLEEAAGRFHEVLRAA